MTTMIPKPSPVMARQQYLGRITHRSAVTETTETVEGYMTLVTGSTIAWTAPATLVEIHVETFNHPQVVADGRISPDGTLRISTIRPALSEEWSKAIASLIAERYDVPTDDPQTEKLRVEKIAQLVLSVVVPLGVTPAEARRKAVQRARKDEKRAEKAAGDASGLLRENAYQQLLNNGDLQVVKTHPMQPDLLEGLGRIASIGLRHGTKSVGTLTLASGQSIRWISRASYTDAMDQLFDGAPVVVRGFFDDKDRFFITVIRAASREEWDVPDAGQEHLMLLSQDTVTAASLLRKQLLGLYGPTCQECGTTLTKSSAAAMQDGDRLMLACHPCKAQHKAEQCAEKAVA